MNKKNTASKCNTTQDVQSGNLNKVSAGVLTIMAMGIIKVNIMRIRPE
jgi:hypothetical protein